MMLLERGFKSAQRSASGVPLRITKGDSLPKVTRDVHGDCGYISNKGQ